MRSTYFLVLACATTIAAVAACGDDDDTSDNDGGGSGTGTVTTGLPKTDKLSSLDDKDAKQACTSTARAFNTVLPDSKLEQIGCALAAISSLLTEKEGNVGSGDVAECKAIVQDCLDGKLVDENGDAVEVSTEVVDATSCNDASASATFQDCDATVANYESCAGKVASELKARFSSIDCDGLKDLAKFMQTTQAEIDVSKAPECKALRDKCPDLDLSGTDGPSESASDEN
jgi:hypothetical protein